MSSEDGEKTKSRIFVVVVVLEGKAILLLEGVVMNEGV